MEGLNANCEAFGEERLSDIVRASLSLSATEICRLITARLQAFVAESPPFADITLVVMKVKPWRARGVRVKLAEHVPLPGRAI